MRAGTGKRPAGIVLDGLSLTLFALLDGDLLHKIHDATA
jgi:hypothetical protein